MAKDKHGPLTGEELEIIQELWGVPYDVEVELPDGDTLKNVRPGYCGAFMSHFKDGGLSFLLPPFLLELLAELKMAFTHHPEFLSLPHGYMGSSQREGSGV